MKRILLLAASFAALAVAAPSLAHEPPQACLDDLCTSVSLFGAVEPGGAASAPTFRPWGFDASGMDRSVRPGDDFFRFANGGWVDRTEIPADRSRFGSFHVLAEQAEQQSRAILEAAGADRAAAGDRAKLGRLYADFLDEAALERIGDTPLQADLRRVRAADTRDELAVLMGEANAGFTASLFGLSVSDDPRQPDRYAVYLNQSGLGLPDRDYYLEPKFAPQLARYRQYVAEVLTLAGWPEAEARAAEVVAFETEVARGSWSRAERRDRDKTYNPMTRAELAQAAPGFPWAPFFNAAGLGDTQRVVVSENTAAPRLAAAFAATPVPVLQAWQAFRTADAAAPYLSKRWVDTRFAFRNRFLQGQPEQRARWKRAVTYADGAMGEALGRLYVERHFPPESKVQMDRMVADLKSAMRGRIERLDWMSPATRAEALDKLSKFGVKIGYPAKWRDYAGLEVRPGDVYGNQVRAQAFNWAYRVGKRNAPVDETEWAMTPQTVNAYYTFVKNEIVFPAAILQAPFFDPKADPAVNYGGIGAVIGHEITHGFDDQGRKSDGDGRLRDWWTPADAARFKVQADRLGAQYEAFEPLPGMRINGQVSMGENIADLGGLLVAHDGYRLSLAGKPAPVLDGFTGDQRFFFGFAQIWRSKFRDDALREHLATGPHSPDMYRVRGTVRNVDAWYDAFGVKPGDDLYVPEGERVRIW